MHTGMHGSEFLERLYPSKPQHRPLSSPERKVAVLHPVVFPALYLAAVKIAQPTHRRRVGSQPVCRDPFGPAIVLQRVLDERQSLRIAPLLPDIGLEDLAHLIHSTPQVMSLAIDLDVHLVEMPAPLRMPSQPVNPMAADTGSEHRTETVPPKPHLLMTYVDPTLLQKILVILQRQRKPNIQHYHKPDHLW